MFAKSVLQAPLGEACLEHDRNLGGVKKPISKQVQHQHHTHIHNSVHSAFYSSQNKPATPSITHMMKTCQLAKTFETKTQQISPRPSVLL